MNADLSAEVEQLYKIKSAQYIRARCRTRLRRSTEGKEVKRKSAGTYVTALFFLVAGEPQISNFLEGYEMVVDLWKYLNR